MSRMLTFHDAAWASARDCAAAGRRADALAFLAPLLSSPAAPRRLVLLAHRLAGRLHAAAQKYRTARKHLRAAAKLDPNCAEVQYEIGLTFENDPYGCDRRAARRFRRAVRLDPRQPKYAAALGRALVRTNRVRAGVKWLTIAAAGAPADATVLAVVIDGLCDAGRERLAAKLATQARFLAPGDRAVRKLWDDARYAAASAGQSRVAADGRRGPVLLPFLRVVGDGVTVRRDEASRPAPHLGRLRTYRTEQG
jgi:tetratricopeptide (TPR) repeat protein